MADMPVWKGDAHEASDLQAAVAHHCTCPPLQTAGARCPAHALLLEQRTIDGLLYVRRSADVWRDGDDHPDTGGDTRGRE